MAVDIQYPPRVCHLLSCWCQPRLNTCLCGYEGELECSCSPIQVQRYRERISGPLLDRIDIHLEFGAVTYLEMAGKELSESSELMHEHVVQAREIQNEHFGKKRKVRCNARACYQSRSRRIAI